MAASNNGMCLYLYDVVSQSWAEVVLVKTTAKKTIPFLGYVFATPGSYNYMQSHPRLRRNRTR